RVRDQNGYVSRNDGSNNLVIVDGAGSSWSNSTSFNFGWNSGGNRLVVTNGGVVDAASGILGEFGNDNQVLVTGPGSLWSYLGNLSVGELGFRDLVVISNGATVTAGAEGLRVGNPILTNLFNGHQVVVDGGTLRVTNATRNALLNIRVGTTVLNAGLIDTD